MAKKIIKESTPANKKPAPQPVAAPAPLLPDPRFPAWLSGFKIQAAIVAILAFVCYINTIKNESAIDDYILITKNVYVNEGFAGLPDIFTKDAFDSYYKLYNSSNQLSGGRYRPLSIATFAIEQQFFGAVPTGIADSVVRQQESFYSPKTPAEHKALTAMHARHFFNVVWFILAVLAILYFLRYIVFRGSPVIALLATIIFAVHPLHTEVVANIKSRDEIMSMLFICLTFICAFKYREQKKMWLLITGLASFFLAFLSKEYAIGLVILLPLSFYLFNRYTFSKSVMASLPYMGVVLVYIFIRSRIVAPASDSGAEDIMNNPYAFASGTELVATKISTVLNYLRLLILPTPLSSDYSYNSIPYKDFSSILVWLSLAVHIALFYGFFYFLRKRHVLCFAIGFYLVNLLLVCNVFFNIGTTMGERLIFHSSLGFAMAAAWLLYHGAAKLKQASAGNAALAACMAVIIVLCGYKTIARNAEWKNNFTLFSADINTVPNSVLVGHLLSSSYLVIADTISDEQTKDEYLYKAISTINHLLAIDHKFAPGFINRGLAWKKLGDIDKAKASTDSARMLYPNYPTLPGIYKSYVDYYISAAWDKYGKNGKYPEAVAMYRKGLAIDSTNIGLWYNLGAMYYFDKHYPEAIAAWQRLLKINPAYTKAQQGIAEATGKMQSPGK